MSCIESISVWLRDQFHCGSSDFIVNVKFVMHVLKKKNQNHVIVYLIIYANLSCVCSAQR